MIDFINHYVNTKILFNTELNKKNKYLKEYLIKKLNNIINLKQTKFLEVGIGNGRFGILLADEVAHYFGVDIDPDYVEIAKKNIPNSSRVNYSVGRAQNIPFKEKFGVVFYANTWHFVKNFNKAIDEVERVLEKKGIFVILEPSENTKDWASPKLRQDSPEFDKDIYEQKIRDLETARKALLEQKKFRVVESEYNEKTKLTLYILQTN